MKNLILILKGMIIGLGQIIPGVSGGMLAITLGLYEKGIEAISNFFKDLKSNFKFLLTVGIGILISVCLCSKLIKFSLNNFYFPTMLLFIGLIIGGVPSLLKKVKNFNSNTKSNVLIAIIVFILITLLSFVSGNNEMNFSNMNIFKYLSLIFVGIIYAATMVIPGISGTAIMMLMGYYDLVISMISNFTDISSTLANLKIVLPFGFGLALGIIYVSKLMNYLLKKHEIKTYYFIIGLVLSSILVMFIQTFRISFDIKSLIIGIVLFFLGYFISKKLEKEN